MTHREVINQLKGHVAASIIGQEQVIEPLIIALLANGNVLINRT